MRLIPADDGWWLIGLNAIVKLPLEAVDSHGNITETYLGQLDTAGVSLDTVRDESVYYATVMLSNSCNFACPYCFQDQAANRINGEHGKNLALPMISSVVNYLTRQMFLHNKEKCHVLLFGGEPLLNPRGCIELLESFQDYMMGAGLITNGYMLRPELVSRLASLKLSHVQVTLDGAENFHNRIRFTRSGGGSYRRILSNLERCSEISNVEWNIRVNITHQNLVSVLQVAHDVVERVAPGNCSVTLALVEETDLESNSSFQVQGSEEYLKALELLTDASTVLLKAGFTLAAPPSTRDCVYCSKPGGDSGIVIGVDGSLYSCWETAGKFDWSVGDIWSGIKTLKLEQGRWVSCGLGMRDRFHHMATRLHEEVLIRAMDACFSQPE